MIVFPVIAREVPEIHGSDCPTVGYFIINTRVSIDKIGIAGEWCS